MTLINYVDNGEVFENYFDTFIPAEKAVLSHEDAFSEKLISYISLTPTYVYDSVTEKYISMWLTRCSGRR